MILAKIAFNIIIFILFFIGIWKGVILLGGCKNIVRKIMTGQFDMLPVALVALLALYLLNKKLSLLTDKSYLVFSLIVLVIYFILSNYLIAFVTCNTII